MVNSISTAYAPVDPSASGAPMLLRDAIRGLQPAWLDCHDAIPPTPELHSRLMIHLCVILDDFGKIWKLGYRKRDRWLRRHFDLDLEKLTIRSTHNTVDGRAIDLHTPQNGWSACQLLAEV